MSAIDDWPWWTAAQALHLIAFGTVDGANEFSPYDPPLWVRKLRDKWGVLHWGINSGRHFSLVRDIRHLLARVKWWRTRSRRSSKYPSYLPTLPPNKRAYIRRLVRHYNKPVAELLADLRGDLKSVIAEKERFEAAIGTACQTLCRGAASGEITVVGRPGLSRVGQFKTEVHEPVPASFFASRTRIITFDGWATCAPDSPEAQYWAGPDWGDLRFMRDELLSCLREPAPGALNPSTDRSGRSQMSGPKRRVAEAKLRHWYSARSRNWPADRAPPSATTDWNDARRVFRAYEVTRDQIRQMRSQQAPAAWTAKGRRRRNARK
jgi:hypothetical protein